MASHPISPSPEQPELDEKPLGYDEGWASFDSFRGILKEHYDKLGGAEEFHRKEREAWNEGAVAWRAIHFLVAPAILVLR